MPRRFANLLGSAGERVVQVGAVARRWARRTAWMTTFIRSRSLFHDEGSVSGAIASRRVVGWRRRLVGRHDVARVHAGRRVPEHGDRRLFLGAELLDPFGLIEQHGDRADQRQPQAARATPSTADNRCGARRQSRSPP